MSLIERTTDVPAALAVALDPFVATLQRAVADPSVDVDKLKEICALMEAREKERARRSYNASMAAAQAEIPQVVKRAENSQTNSVYATLEAVGAAIDPIVHKHGFSLSYTEEDCPKPNHIRVACDIFHRDGFERHARADIPIDAAGIAGKVNKTPTHAFGSTVSYARRYLQCMIFDVKSRKALPDDDGNGGREATPARSEIAQRYFDQVVERLKAESDRASLLAWWNSEEAKKERADMLDRDSQAELLGIAKARIAEF